MTDVTTGEGGLRVALVCPYSLTRPGGVQGQVLGLARSLSRRGHEVTVCAPVDGPADLPRGVRFVDAGRSTGLRANGSVAPLALSPRAARRAVAHLVATEPDVIHVHEPLAPGVPWALLAGRPTAPVVGTFHRSGAGGVYGLLGPVAARLARRLAARCAVSEAAAATATAVLGGTVEVLFNGIEVDRYDGVPPWPVDGPTVLFLGRHEERKGLAVLLEAWAALAVDRAGPGAPPELWVAGDGPATAALRDRHGTTARVQWLGVLSEGDKDRRLVAADVVAAPSLGGESFGLVLLEAMAARTVVVASDIDGYRQAAGGCAVLVPAGDATALAGALSGVLDGTAAGGPSGREDWLEAGAARAASWSMDSLAARYEERYRAVVVGAGS